MFSDRLRVPIFICLFLALLCTAGWLLPDHFCRMESCMDCQPAVSCCDTNDTPDLDSAEAPCCFDVNGYYNFPVFSGAATVLEWSLQILKQEFNSSRFLFRLLTSDSPPVEAKPPDLIIAGSGVFSLIGVFRI